jgi:hypothetical protein
LGGRLVFTFPEISAVYIADPDTRETLTSIEAINAVGDTIPGFLILPGQVLLQKYFDNNVSDDTIFATNEETGSGFTNDMLALDWLEHWELATRPGVRTRNGTMHSGEYRILVMDGHGSHLTKEFMDYCWDHKVVPFLLPAHSTHLLQPLDVGVFGPMKGSYQSILAEQVRYGGCDYTKSDFLDAYQEVRTQSLKKSTIIHAWAKAGLWPLMPRVVLDTLKRVEPHRDNRFQTPEEEEQEVFREKWANCQTPELKLPAIQKLSTYIDSRLSGAIDGSIPLTPTVARVLDKRNKAQNIMALNGTLASEELEKRRAEEARKARHKRDGGQRRIATEYGTIKAGDARLRICGRAQFIQQKKDERLRQYNTRIEREGYKRWGIISRAAARRGRSWEPRDKDVLRRYKHWMAELLYFHRTGSCTLLLI